MTKDSAGGMTTLVRLRPWSTIVALGPDCRSWLNGLVTCDVAATPHAQSGWGLILMRTGKIQSPVVIAGEEEKLWLGIESPHSQAVWDFLEQRLIMEDVELAAPTNPVAWLTLHGPRAQELAQLWSEQARVPVAHLAWTPHGDAALPATADFAAQVRGAATSLGDDVVFATDAEWAARRIASGFPEFGVDYDERRNPHEASLERRAVSWSKGCYVGQEAVCMQDMRGKVKRRLVALQISGVAPDPEAVVEAAPGVDVGRVTSSTPLADGSSAAMAIVDADHSTAGTQLWISGVQAQIIAPRF